MFKNVKVMLIEHVRETGKTWTFFCKKKKTFAFLSMSHVRTLSFYKKHVFFLFSSKLVSEWTGRQWHSSPAEVRGIAKP